MKKSFLVGVLAFAVALPSFAGDADAQAHLDEALFNFEERNAQDLGPTTEALKLLDQAQGQAESLTLKFDILVLASRAEYWNGVHTDEKKAKESMFVRGQANAVAATDLMVKAGTDYYSEGYYFAAVNLARWGESKGVPSAYPQTCNVVEYVNNAIQRKSRDGQEGLAIDGYGPNRVLGRVDWKLASFQAIAPKCDGVKTGNIENSEKVLKLAYEMAPKLALNAVYYAETLAHKKLDKKALAIQVLDQLLANDPNTFNESRIPETHEEFELAAALRKELK